MISPLFDTHCHLNIPPLSQNIHHVITRSQDTGIVGIVAPGTDIETSIEISQIAKQYPGFIWPAIGIHPQAIIDVPIQLQQVLELLLLKINAVAIGEIGLDYEVANPSREEQIQRLKVQLAIAQAHNLPILIHCRKAFSDLYDILQKNSPKAGGILHSWSGSNEMLEKFIKLGFYYGVSGVITLPTSTRRRQFLCNAPLERMVLETDAPYIATQTTKKNLVEPHHIAEICRSVAEIKGISVEEVARITTENARRVLRLLR